MLDAIVIGGGIVGMSTAYHLVAERARTLVIDRADEGQATAAGAGIISPATSAITNDAWYALAFAAADYYGELVKLLDDAGAGDTGYAPRPELVVAVTPDEDEPFAKKLDNIRAHQARFDRPKRADFELLDSEGAHQLFPPLGEIRHAMVSRRAARVDGRLLTQALKRDGLRQGLRARQGNVTQIALGGDRASGVIVDGEFIPCGAVVIAGGAWSGALGEILKLTLPISPQRGQIVHLAFPEMDTSTLAIVSALHGHYLLPWDDHRVVVGATREFVGFETHTTAEGIQRVLDEALRVAPGLRGGSIADIRVGLRPTTPDYLPILGRTPRYGNVYLATGHGPTGLTTGPYSGKLIADLIVEKELEVPLDAFSVERFRQS